MSKTTKEECEQWREQWQLTPDIYGFELRLLDDADRLRELEANPLLAHASGLLMQQRIDELLSRIAELEAVLRTVDTALESEFGGFYLSAPVDEPLGGIREMLRG